MAERRPRQNIDEPLSRNVNRSPKRRPIQARPGEGQPRVMGDSRRYAGERSVRDERRYREERYRDERYRDDRRYREDDRRRAAMYVDEPRRREPSHYDTDYIPRMEKRKKGHGGLIVAIILILLLLIAGGGFYAY